MNKPEVKEVKSDKDTPRWLKHLGLDIEAMVRREAEAGVFFFRSSACNV